MTPDFAARGGLHYRWPDLPGPQIEERIEAKKNAVWAFADANPIDHALYGVPQARFGIVTTGKGHLDLMEALRLLGLDERACRRLGIDIYKVGMVWPLAPGAARSRSSATSRRSWSSRKSAASSRASSRNTSTTTPATSPSAWSASATRAATGSSPGSASSRRACWRRSSPAASTASSPTWRLPRRAAGAGAEPPTLISVPGATRTPYFCSGCPHNTSTKVPEGSQALAGIGCHFMASWMDRETTSLIQMGGEGVNWAATLPLHRPRPRLPEPRRGHLLPFRLAWPSARPIAAGANITYKILYNDAVAMTGGQPVDGPISVEGIATSLRRRRRQRIALVSDHPEKFAAPVSPPATSFQHRRELDAVQRELREIQGVTVLIYEQTCATEKRRPPQARHAGRTRSASPSSTSWSAKAAATAPSNSNCLSVEPLETEFGRKRAINLSTCNKDFSCLNGFCPSFVTVEGVTPPQAQPAPTLDAERSPDLPAPESRPLDDPYDLLVTGVGGTGVVTVGALISMAAHLEGKGATVLDFTGFAQKFGPVLSFLRPRPRRRTSINQVRIDPRSADASSAATSSSPPRPRPRPAYRRGTRVVLNLAEMPTGDVVRPATPTSPSRPGKPPSPPPSAPRTSPPSTPTARPKPSSATASTPTSSCSASPGSRASSRYPSRLSSAAIDLNGVAREKNHAAFACGRLLAAKPDALPLAPPPAEPETLDTLIDRRAAFLADYQDAAYADRYRRRLAAFRAALPSDLAEPLTATAARSLFKLMAYKDEYEVARLHASPEFAAKLADAFEGAPRLRYHLAPPFLPAGKDARGRPLKRTFGPWLTPLLRGLAPLRRLRGTWADPFGYAAERREERALIVWYEALLERAASAGGAAPWPEVLAAPMEIRGYGPVKAAAIARVRAAVPL